MSQRYRHRRTFSPGTAFPSPLEPGEIAVNTANRQIAVGDAAAGVLGVPLPLLGVRIFDARASYATNDYVVQGGSFYRAKSAINPGAFNASQWDVMSTDAALKAYADAGDAAVSAAFAAADTTITTNYQSADTVLTTSVNGKVAKAGDTMTGPLVLPADPTTALQSATKQYVDNKIAAIPTPSSLTVSDTPPVGVPDGALWWESDSGLLYVRYNDGNTIQWVIAAPQPDINAFALANTVVRYDTAQSLTTPQQQQARQNIYAAPFDAMAYSGLQINGAMEVSQENGTNVVGVINASKYVVDGWQLASAGVQTVNALQNTNAPTGFFNSLGCAVAGANASPGAGDYSILAQSIEGYRVRRLAFGTANAQPVTISFWVNAVRPGNYSGTLVNGATNRSYAFVFTINATNTWEYKTITIPGDTTGTWAKDNTAGLRIYIGLLVGSTFQTAANAWTAGNYFGATGTVNGAAATTDAFYITGLTVLPGNEAPSAARSPFVMRPYDQELVTCQRYYEPLTFPTTGLAQLVPGGLNGANYYSQWYFHAKKRATPTIALAPGAAWAVGTPTAYPGIDNVIFYVSANSAFVLTGTAGANGLIADARL
jgi:hypothetical protein